MYKQSKATRAGKVLVIDDDEIALEAIRELLVDAGYEVQCLSSPIGATQVIVSQGIEAVVVDLNMPVMSGDRFISLLRSWDRIRDLPTVLISGSDTETLENSAMGIPGVQTVTKDSMRRALPEALRRVLSKERGQGGARRSLELSADTRRALSGAAQNLATTLNALHPERRTAWEPVVAGFRSLREQAESAGVPILSKALGKAQELVELCARETKLGPDERLALTRTLDTLGNLSETTSASNLAALLNVHVTRLERILEG